MAQNSSNSEMSPATRNGLLLVIIALLGCVAALQIGGTTGLVVTIALALLVAVGAGVVARASLGTGDTP